LKVATNVKIAMQCLKIFGGGKCPKCPPWLRAWSTVCLHRRFAT